MKVASICDECFQYINANCVIYNGENLNAIDTTALESLDEILASINSAYNAIVGTNPPTNIIPKFIGQKYIDTSSNSIWIGLSTTHPVWGLVGTYSTTTTTTSSTTTTTTTV